MIERQSGELRYLQFEHYQQFPEFIHGIFTRSGGYSQPPYEGLNTSTSRKIVGADSVENVVRNRQLALGALALAEQPCVTLWQIHSADVLTFDRRDGWRTDWAYESYYELTTWTTEAIRKGDGIISSERGTTITLSFADCTPLLFYDPVKHAMAVVHGGWRGTVRGIALATVEAMRDRLGCEPGDIYAGIGPAIGKCCYEVSQEVEDLFLGRTQFEEMPTDERYRGIIRESAAFSTRDLPDRKSLRLDLWATNRNQLLMAGVLPEHIEVAEVCTSCCVESFFSHRKEGGRTGRFPVILGMH